ncbi:hypothetical protein B0H17DRAFT_980823 [Mycena rosella]|uniref:WD-like domain-containing protein n=1 Tax=Mycena rosella TaxID=1033263 RepID=A0AAD7GGY0_MYCRO|nr:hypothetical protein B0H17DRAFT_980823 [Mycena rosella]
MHFSNLPIVAVLALAAGLVTSAPTADNLLTISHVVAVGEYNLTYWTDAPVTPIAARAPAPRACTGATDVTCSGSHAASPTLCTQLIATVNANSGNIIGDAPRAVCLGQSSNQCCISWSDAVGPMLQGALAPAATKVFDVCFADSALLESGLDRDVILNGGCVTQCLSNRPGGCTN